MTIRMTCLSNGLRVVTRDRPGFGSVALQITVGVGSRDETLETSGLSHVLEHVLFKGTQSFPTAKIISDAIEGVGGNTNAYTSNELTAYTARVLTDDMPLALSVLCSMMREPLFDPAELKMESGAILEEFNDSRDDASDLAVEAMMELTFPGHPLGRSVIGSEEVIRGLTAPVVAGYWRRHYSPNRMVVTAVGRVDHDRVVDLVAQLLGDLPSGPDSSRLIVPASAGLPMAVAVPSNKFSSVQVMISGRTFSEDHPMASAIRVLSGILGDGMSSRLFQSVREQQGLAYSVGCFTDFLSDVGMMAAAAGVNTAKSVRALESIWRELMLMRHLPVDEAELDRVKRLIAAANVFGTEGSSSQASRLGEQMIVRGRCESVDDKVARINAVTADEVMQAARTVLAPENLRLVVVGKKAATERLVAAFEKLVASA